jgi:hypothetical protein
LTAQFLVSWLLALGLACTMVSLGVGMRLLEKPRLMTRCVACGRLVRRGRSCPCTTGDSND